VSVVLAYGKPGAIPPVEERFEADRWDNIVREWGVVYACEWFGYAPESPMVEFITRQLMERSGLPA